MEEQQGPHALRGQMSRARIASWLAAALFLVLSAWVAEADEIGPSWAPEIVAMDRSGSVLALGGGSQVLVYRLPGRAPIVRMRTSGYYDQVVVSPEGGSVLAVGSDQDVVVFSSTDGRVLWSGRPKASAVGFLDEHTIYCDGFLHDLRNAKRTKTKVVQKMWGQFTEVPEVLMPTRLLGSCSKTGLLVVLRGADGLPHFDRPIEVWSRRSSPLATVGAQGALGNVGFDDECGTMIGIRSATPTEIRKTEVYCWYAFALEIASRRETWRLALPPDVVEARACPDGSSVVFIDKRGAMWMARRGEATPLHLTDLGPIVLPRINERSDTIAVANATAVVLVEGGVLVAISLPDGRTLWRATVAPDGSLSSDDHLISRSESKP